MAQLIREGDLKIDLRNGSFEFDEGHIDLRINKRGHGQFELRINGKIRLSGTVESVNLVIDDVATVTTITTVKDEKNIGSR